MSFKSGKEMYKVTVLLSGGIDSTILLALLLNQEIDCTPFFVDYGQVTAIREHKCAKAISAHYGLKLESVSIDEVSKLTNNQITNPTVSKNPFYPNRNLLLLTLASLYAYEKNHDGLSIGVVKAIGTTPFPDIEPEFFTKFSEMLAHSLDKELAILTPFIENTKFQVVEFGKELYVPFELTYSCLTNNEKPCGKCESCKSREEVLGDYDV